MDTFAFAFAGSSEHDSPRVGGFLFGAAGFGDGGSFLSAGGVEGLGGGLYPSFFHSSVSAGSDTGAGGDTGAGIVAGGDTGAGANHVLSYTPWSAVYTGATAFGNTVVVSGCAIRPDSGTCKLSVGVVLEAPPGDISGSGGAL